MAGCAERNNVPSAELPVEREVENRIEDREDDLEDPPELSDKEDTDGNTEEKQEITLAPITEEKVLPERYEIGERVFFGRYGGEKISWTVLADTADGALLWTDYCIDAQPYNNGRLEKVSWESCTLRQWLNTEFMDVAFDEKEQKHIIRSGIENMDCGVTEDCIFILSAAELDAYAGDNLTGYPTAYAANNGLFVNDGMSSMADRGKSCYWIRGNHEGQPSSMADWIDVKGEVRYNLEISEDEMGGVRPAFWYSYMELEQEQRPGISDYVLEDSAVRYLIQEDLQGMSAEQLRLARNEIYARHGYQFDDPALNEYFTSKSWYYPAGGDKRFYECLLNIYEKYNVQMILAAEQGTEYTGELLQGYGYEEISENIEKEFSGDVDLAFFEDLCGTWGTQSGKIVSITPERFNGYLCRILKFEYNNINMWYEIVFEVYYEDDIRLMKLTRFREAAESFGAFEMAYFDRNGEKLKENGYEVENDRFEIEYTE